MSQTQATEIKLKAQRQSILIDGVVETGEVIENGVVRYYQFKNGLPHLTIEVVENRVNNSKLSTD
jgi:hypothetical protein